jgi:hypothetical protein
MIGILIIVIIVYMGLFIKSSEKTYAQISEPSYALAIVEDVLVARNLLDYEKYITFISDDSKKFETKGSFKSDVYFVRANWGDYIPGSLKFKEAWLDRTYNETLKVPYNYKWISVYYEARFTKEPSVNIPISAEFLEIKGKPEFQNINFNVSGEQHLSDSKTSIVN